MTREKLTLAWRGTCAPVPDFACVVSAPLLVRTMTPARPEIVCAPGVPLDPLELCLELWKTWMADGIDRDLGTQTMRGLQADGDGHGVDSHEAQRANDIRIAQATDAMIDSMQRQYIWAIYKLCSQATPWHFPNASLIDIGQVARAELRRLLQKNVCTAVLF